MSIDTLIGLYNHTSVEGFSSFVTSSYFSPNAFQHQSIDAAIDDDGPDLLLGAMGMFVKMTDAMDAVSDYLESEDIIRNGRSADVLLYYMEYIPGRGHKDDLFEESNLGKEYESYEHVGFIEYHSAGFDAEDFEIPYSSIAVEADEERRFGSLDVEHLDDDSGNIAVEGEHSDDESEASEDDDSVSEPIEGKEEVESALLADKQ